MKNYPFVTQYLYISVNDIQSAFGNPDSSTMINILNVDEEKNNGYVEYTYRLTYNNKEFLLQGSVKYGQNDRKFDFFLTGGTTQERAEIFSYCRTYASERQVQNVLKIVDQEIMKNLLAGSEEYGLEKYLDNSVINDILENNYEQR